jgi:hypothetical protein
VEPPKRQRLKQSRQLAREIQMKNFDNASTIAKSPLHHDEIIGQLIARISNKVPFAIADRRLFDQAIRIWTAWMNEYAELNRIDDELEAEGDECDCPACLISPILERRGYSLTNAFEAKIGKMLGEQGREQTLIAVCERVDMIAAAQMGIDVNSL